MNDNDIIKALEELLLKSLNIKYGARKSVLITDDLLRKTLDLINRLKRESNSYRNKAQTQKGELARLNKQVAEQKAEIERLQHQLETLCLTLKLAKSEAIKEFAERLKETTSTNVLISNEAYVDIRTDIDNLVKEMTEGKE